MRQATILFYLYHAYVSALPSLTARDTISNDVLRYIKCTNLSHSDGEKTHEQGMSGWFADGGAKGVAPDHRVIFDMATATDDVFYNGQGSVYKGDYQTGVGRMWSDFFKPYSSFGPQNVAKYRVGPVGAVHPPAPHGVWIGHASNVPEKAIETAYNCFTEGEDGAYTYEDPEYETYKTYVTCKQRDALQVSSLLTQLDSKSC
jgi:hypothetical protein